jgi:predicted nucleic acid-binding protein
MILVDSSVWIDYFRGVDSPQTDRLDSLLGNELLLTGDLIVAEVLQGFQPEAEFNKALRLMTGNLAVVSLVGPENAVQAARNYRILRANSVTVRKTIDTLIATYCIENDHALLFSDHDFNPFVDYLGLRTALCDD